MESSIIKNPIKLAVAASAFLFLSIGTAHAGEKDADEWKFKASVYLWGAALKADTSTGGTIDLSFSDIVDNLNMVFMGNFEARKQKWSIFNDALYLNIGASKSRTEPLGPGGVDIEVKVKNKAFINTLVGGYTVVDNENLSLDLTAGVRYLYMEVPLKVKVGSAKKSVSPSGDTWDGIVGVRGRVKLNEEWYLPYYFDIGAGDTDLTWQAMAGVGYQYGSWDFVGGYRYLDFDFKDGAPLEKLTVDGPFVGAVYKF